MRIDNQINLLKEKFISFQYKSILFLLLFLGLLATRRWQQLFSPQVWDEDGTQNLAGFINNGWYSLFEPVNGYLIMIPKLISAISLEISFAYYPFISTVISWFFIVLIGFAVLYSPTKLRFKTLCAISIFIIPTDPEVFGLPLYTFWWSSLLLFLVALWDEKYLLLKWRIFFLLIGGLSSPLIVLILPVLYFRMYWYKMIRSELIIGLLATPVAATQLYFILKGEGGNFPPLDSVLSNIIPKFFGDFFIGNWVSSKALLWVSGLIALLFLLYWFLSNKHHLSTWILNYLLVGTIVLSVIRVDPEIMHPVLAGPRYFFFPFILLFWILIQFLHKKNTTILRGFVSLLICLVIINSIPAWSRNHDELNWIDHVISCSLFSEYNIPVHYDGHKSSAWLLKLNGKVCDKLLKNDTLISKSKLDKYKTFPYISHKKDNYDITNNRSIEIVRNTMKGTDFYRSKHNGYRIIGSFETSDADTGVITLRLNKNDQVFYRSGPGTNGQLVTIDGLEQKFINKLPIATDWTQLIFSNSKLPPQFLVTFKDEGQNLGEWSAIAIKK